MTGEDKKSCFDARLLCPRKQGDGEPWAFVILPGEVSAKLPRRGRTSVDATLNGHAFRVLLEPDGRKSHWLRIDQPLMEASGTTFGDVARLEISPVAREPEPEVPEDLREALQAAPEARAVWEATTTLARVDWIHWITTAKQAKTRAKRIDDACDMLASGKKRVCCFDPSGFYSKALRAPEAVN
ncbi:hypothetical protein BN2364_0787 [Alloalcanivorax xenomutans]|uniref:YdeI/OmpD-associated family protein n=1 Tax=Alloalcanivorax xenomutans TaxID=1094342 RepID=UPI0006D5BF0A|nr:YdeI/OmpD-associated family protein [Alloalcanivorax xenomutans]MBA4721516.1 DUF1905 domain-containing protein [Alcanivorax sp.]PHS55359.1 MAG: hypothetical protein COB00_21215 [Alcanivorax sp.]CUR45228.1 hypothetical protein BN2364_0787 [Alloalcanivorax xenomutans]